MTATNTMLPPAMTATNAEPPADDRVAKATAPDELLEEDWREDLEVLARQSRYSIEPPPTAAKVSPVDPMIDVPDSIRNVIRATESVIPVRPSTYPASLGASLPPITASLPPNARLRRRSTYFSGAALFAAGAGLLAIGSWIGRANRPEPVAAAAVQPNAPAIVEHVATPPTPAAPAATAARSETADTSAQIEPATPAANAAPSPRAATAKPRAAAPRPAEATAASAPAAEEAPAVKPADAPSGDAPGLMAAITDAVSRDEARGSGGDAPKAAVPAATTASFDRGAAAAALANIAASVSSCRSDGVEPGRSGVSVTFAPNGSVSAVSLDGGPFSGTATGRCILGLFRGAAVPPFSGAAITVHRSFMVK